MSPNNIDYLSLFQYSAEMLGCEPGREDLDDAISILADWLNFNSHELTEDDLFTLIKIGAILYREVNK